MVNVMVYPPSLFLHDGTEVRLVPLNRTAFRPLYCAADGRVFSFCRRYLYPLKPTITNYPCSKPNGRRKQVYLKLRQDYGNILIHIAVALAWHGDPNEVCTLSAQRSVFCQTKPVFECHHLNGITFDNRASNLIWLSPSEHRRFDAALHSGLILTRVDPGASSR